MTDITPEILQRLGEIDTPTVCNALEVLCPERRGYGYTVEPLVCGKPDLPPMVGFARTATIRAMHPSDIKGREARALSDAYYTYIAEGPQPCIVVLQDLDGSHRGYGSFWGEVNSTIHKGLGALGVITDGSVRDLPDFADGFQFLANRVGPSHAYVHVVDFSTRVTVAGMRVVEGDLIHADQHGAVIIPLIYAAEVNATADLIARRERVIIDAARQPGFNMDALRKAQGSAAEIH
jgi:regulator of RNase E activity RraA